jgi:transposase-like protein
MWVQFVAAIDQFGQVIDVLVSVKRDLATTRRFFIRPGTWPRPNEVTIDRDLVIT